MTVELSAYYFDIRKDALYCDPISQHAAPGGADGDRPDFRAAGGMACADAALHHGGSVGPSLWQCGAVGSSCAISRDAFGLARSSARGDMGGGVAGALGHHRCAGAGARRQANRLVARSGARGACDRFQSLPRRSRGSIWRRLPSLRQLTSERMSRWGRHFAWRKLPGSRWCRGWPAGENARGPGKSRKRSGRIPNSLT